MKYRKDPKVKIKSPNTNDIEKLILFARADGYRDPQDIACWIIDRSPYWRSAGYKEIIKKIK